MKEVTWHPGALKTVQSFPKEVKKDLGYLLFRLQHGDHIGMPYSKPMKTVAPGVSELRVKDSSGIYRVFYFLKVKNEILIFHAFKKKSQKAPQKELNAAEKNLKELIDGN